MAAQSGFTDAVFLSHDMSRMISRLWRKTSADTGRGAGGVGAQLTVSGVPFIFRGEELG
nr:alpha-amylase family glycosyl hydrolase [Enterobacter sp. RHBSTW-01064]